MHGPTQRWDQPPDPRESTVSIPRIESSSPASQVSEPAAAAYDGVARAELPGFGDPYALPGRSGEPAPARAGGSGGSSPRLLAAPAPAPEAELAVTPERAAAPAPTAVAELAVTPERPAAPAPAAVAELAVTPERPAASAPTAVSLPEHQAPPVSATPEPAVPAEPAEPEELIPPETPGQSGAVGRDATGQPPRRAVRRAGPVAAGKPPTGSIAELRGRLERLPDGHPSSPYDDGGWLKPSPTRLRQLELGLPARPASAPAGYAERFGIDSHDDWLNDGLPGAAATDPRPQSRALGAGSPASGDHHDPGDGDGRPQLQHPYAPTARHDQGGNGSGAGDLALTRWPARDTAADGESGPADHRNGHHPAAKPAEASPAEPAGPGRERPRPDPGRGELSRRGDGATAAHPRLAPELRDLVDRILAACRAAEGRSARGSYGTSGLTPALRRIAAALPAGGLAPGSETDTLKPADRFAVRLARLIDRQPGRPPAELAATISDGIRYAFTFPAAGYSEGTLLVHRKLKAQGFDLEARRNQWDSREYKGIFTRWRDPAHGLAFEVQFHTTDSWAVVKQTHDDYLRITNPVTPAAERARLRGRLAAAAATVSVPPGCLDIADFRAVAR